MRDPMKSPYRIADPCTCGHGLDQHTDSKCYGMVPIPESFSWDGCECRAFTSAPDETSDLPGSGT